MFVFCPGFWCLCGLDVYCASRGYVLCVEKGFIDGSLLLSPLLLLSEGRHRFRRFSDTNKPVPQFLDVLGGH